MPLEDAPIDRRRLGQRAFGLGPGARRRPPGQLVGAGGRIARKRLQRKRPEMERPVLAPRVQEHFLAINETIDPSTAK